ncbi:MAG: hypothetical protein AB1752_08745 [Candidatus Zixiibacteriota bacterium]
MKRLLIFAEGSGIGLRDPLDQLRAAFLLRNGVWTIARRWELLLKPDRVAAAVRPWLRDLTVEQTGWAVNQPIEDGFDDVWIVTGCATPTSATNVESWPADFGWNSVADSVVRLSAARWDSARATVNDWITSGGSQDTPVQSPRQLDQGLLTGAAGLWDLVNRVPEQIAVDARLWRASGRTNGTPKKHDLTALVGESNMIVGEDVTLGAHTVLDATSGPIIIDDRVSVEPFTRIDGPAYIGADTRLAGGKITGGCAIGPACRIGGELENTIVQGFTNKVHEGFFGHGFLGEWVNLGALATNSDLKNTYGTVRVMRGGQLVDTGCLKVGSYLSDHTKMGIGTLLPTGATMGVGVNCAVGGLTSGFIPAFIWDAGGSVAEHDIERMLKSASIAIERRGRERRAQSLPVTMTEAEKAALRHLHTVTAIARTRYLDDARQR